MSMESKVRISRSAEIGQRLKKLREDKGLSLSELSAATGKELSKSRISNYEQGIRRPGIEELELLAAVLGVTPSSIVGW